MLLVVRHGETDWNRENRILGRTDIPLNEAGIRQAKKVARQMKNIPLHAIFTSPLSRASRTAEIIAAAQPSPTPLTVEPCLIEHNFGSFEGQNRHSGTYQQEKRKFVQRYPGGESFLDLAARIYPFLESLGDRFAPQENLLLVTHGGVFRVIHSWFHPMENEEFVTFAPRNCEIRIYQF